MNTHKPVRKKFQYKYHHFKFCFLDHKQIRTLPDIRLKIFGEVFARSKVASTVRSGLTVTPEFSLWRTKQRTHENICKCIIYVILEAALLLYMLLVRIALKIFQFQISKMKPGFYNISNGRQ